MMIRLSFVHLLLIILLASHLKMGILACAPAPRNGQFVSINEEAAVIVWDAQTRTEHFIRAASFSGAEEFGFLVPTPTKPQLAEAREALQTVSQLIKPKVVTEDRFSGFDFTPALSALLPQERETATTAIPASRGAVRVLDEQQVAGYDAVVLEADSAKALNEWLAKHGYDARPALVEWLEPYVKAHWKITAFKIMAKGNRFSTSPVRMSFTTDKPFFPYREPADLRSEKALSELPRSLKLFLLSNERLQGTLGKMDWPGEVVWANRVEEALRQSIANDCGLTPQKLPANLWLTAIEDKASPRPGTDDVFFATATTQSIVTPPPIVLDKPWHIPLPADVLLLLAILVFSLWWWRKRKARLLSA